jgi:RpiR family carbohydrate utilization transcriptional regulator
VIAVTSFPRSPLVEVASVVLVAATRETTYRVEALASRIAHLVVLDSLWLATALRLGEGALALTRRINDVVSDHRF